MQSDLQNLNPDKPGSRGRERQKKSLRRGMG